LPGDIWLKDGRVVRNEKIIYDKLNDQLLWLEPSSNQTVMLDKEAIVKFHFLNVQGDTSVLFRKITARRGNSGDSVEIFAQEMSLGNLILFISHSVYYAGREKVRMQNGYTLKEIYKDEPFYFLQHSNDVAVEFKKSRRKNLYDYLPQCREQIRDYIRLTRTGKIRTTKEIIDFSGYLSSIIE
jgi:hypothetical protein